MGLLCNKCKKNKNSIRSQILHNQKDQVKPDTLIEQEKQAELQIQKNKDSSEVIKESETLTENYFDKEDLKHIKQMLERVKEKEKYELVTKREIINYKKGNLIGEGSYGKVYQAFDEDVGQIIAIKEIDIRRYTNSGNSFIEAKISSFEAEIAILSQLNHKNIIKYYGTKRTNESFHIFLEFCIGGSIAKILEIYKFLTENVIKKYTKQILEGLEYLHAHNVIHRDIKGPNILVDRDGLCKLSDFGGAKVIKDEIEFKQQNSFKGTPNWMAPETVRSMEYTRFSDIWSIGCTVIEMATGEPPWANYKNPMATLYNLMHTNTPPKFPEHLSETCKHFLSCCLKINPKERLNVCKLLKHPFIIGNSPYNYEVGLKMDLYESNMSNNNAMNQQMNRQKSEEDRNNRKRVVSKNRSQEEGNQINNINSDSNKVSDFNNLNNLNTNTRSNSIKQNTIITRNNLSQNVSLNMSQNNQNNNPDNILSNNSDNVMRELKDLSNLPDVKNLLQVGEIKTDTRLIISNNTEKENSSNILNVKKYIDTNNDNQQSQHSPTTKIGRSVKRQNTEIMQNTSQNNISQNQVQIQIGDCNLLDNFTINLKELNEEIENKVNMGKIHDIEDKLNIKEDNLRGNSATVTDKEKKKNIQIATSTIANEIRIISDNNLNDNLTNEDEFLSKDKSENNQKKVLIKIPRKSKAISEYLNNMKK